MLLICLLSYIILISKICNGCINVKSHKNAFIGSITNKRSRVLEWLNNVKGLV